MSTTRDTVDKIRYLIGLIIKDGTPRKLDQVLPRPRVLLPRGDYFLQTSGLSVEEEAEEILHMGRCSLWIRNMDIKR